jgi:hypothetical protein
VPSGTTCTTTATTIQNAITAATSGTTIRVGSGAYADGPYVLPNQVSLQGNGAGTGATATKLSLNAGAQTYVTANQGTVSDLRVDMSTGNGATGIAASNGAIVDNVVIYGVSSTSSTGLQVQGSQAHDVTVNVTGGSGNTAVKGMGGNSFLSESTWNGGAVGYRQVAGTDTVSRATVQLADTAVLVEGGTLNIDDSVLDLGATGTRGLLAHPTGPAATVAANHLTVVGGAPTAAGVMADATDGLINLTLTNSIVRGPGESLSSVAGGSLTVSRSDYQTKTAGVTDGGGNLTVDPAFVDPAGGDYHLRATSPVVDGALSSSASLDRDGKQRFDGDKDGTTEPDMGAYELRDVTAPKTTFSAGPQGPTNDSTPVFQFKANEGGATLECRLDGGAWLAKCTSPATTAPLANGAHSFQVRATDAAFNVEDPPATRSFVVDTTSPNATITKKPPKRFFKKRVKFKFAVSERGAKLQCNLDNRGWRTCQTTYRFNVKVGKHRIQVRAVDAAGNVDPTPAHYTYRRVKRHR